MNNTRLNRRNLLLAAGALALPGLGRADGDYPTLKPIRLVVPFSAGGSSDVVGRAVAQWMETDLKQTVIVDNKPGAAGAIGADFVAKSAPDGYTLLLADANHVSNTVFTRNIPYDPVGDFTAIGGIGKTPLFLVCNPNFKPRTVGEMIDYAHKHPGKLNIGIPGNGSIVFETIRHLSKAKVTVVPYKGTAAALIDLAGGSIDLVLISIASGAGYVKNGQVRMMATTSPQRHPDYPDVPTFAESGLPGVEYEQWFGILGPAGVPAPVAQRLSRSITLALDQPEMKVRLGALAMERYDADAAAFRERLRADGARWRKLGADAHIVPV